MTDFNPETQLPATATVAAHNFGRFLGHVLYRPTFNVKFVGLERFPAAGPLLVLANHSSLIEPQLLYSRLPRRILFMVKAEAFVGPLGWFLRSMGHIPVHRSKADVAALTAATKLLRGGGVLAIFPEGTRGSGDVTAIEQGAAWLTRASGATILPIAIRGTARPAGSKLRFRPRVDILIGHPVALTIGKGKKGIDDGTERIREILADLVRELDEGYAA